MKRQRKSRRVFSTAFKREKVELIEQGKLSVKDLCLIYEVSDRAYNWLKKYSKYSSGERIVVEKISEEKKNKELMVQIRELEHALGQKQKNIMGIDSI